MKEIRKLLRLDRWFSNPVDAFRDWTGNEPFPYQKRVLDVLNDLSVNRILICSGSGLGKTYLLAFISLYCSYIYSYPKYMKTLGLTESYSVLIASGSLPQAQYLYEHTRRFIENVPEIEEDIEGVSTKTFTKFRHGGTIRALPSAESSLFSYHANLFIIDEGVEAGDKVIDHAYRIIRGKYPNRIIIASTPHRAESRFVEMWENRGKYRNWVRFHFDPRENPMITREELEEAMRGMPRDKFESLILGIPSRSPNAVFDIRDLRECRVDNVSMGEGEVRMGVDWGFTVSKTGIVIVQIEGREWNVLHCELVSHPRMEDLLGKIESLYRLYNVRTVYCDLAQKGENQRLRERGLPVVEVHFSKERGLLMNNLRALIEQHRLRIPERFVDLFQQLARYDPKRGKDDDLVDALAMTTLTGVARRPKWVIKKIVRRR